MKLIKLSKNYATSVDDEVFDAINAFAWCAQETKSGKVYACRMSGRKKIYLHRFLTKASPKFFVDHRDGDGLNNLLSNLRICSPSENLWNQKKIKKATSSRFKGVTFIKNGGIWKASIRRFGKRFHIGYFKDEIAAGMAYREAAKKFHGEFANW